MSATFLVHAVWFRSCIQAVLWRILVVAAGLLAAGTSLADPVAPIGGPLPEIVLYSEENPPFAFTDPKTGQFGGPVMQLVQEAARRAGVQYRLRLYPWTRGYQAVLSDRNSCIFPTNVTDARKPLFAWIGPFGESAWVLIGRQDFPGQLPDLNAARRFRIAVPPDSGGIRQFLVDFGGLELVPVLWPNAFRMLKSGRVDLVAAGALNATAFARAANVDIQTVLTFRRSTMAVACNRDSDPALLKALTDAVHGMTDDGTLDSMFPWRQAMKGGAPADSSAQPVTPPVTPAAPTLP
jgi:polar amino acid transport system substrate-binding protein